MKERITQAMKSQKGAAFGVRELAKRAQIRRRERDEFTQALQDLKQQGILIEKKNKLSLSEGSGVSPAHIVKVTQTFGFAHREGDSGDLFIPGRDLLGAMPGDAVLVRVRAGRGELMEASVVKITESADKLIRGVLTHSGKSVFVTPLGSSLSFPLQMQPDRLQGAQEGDIVSVQLLKRGRRHDAHRFAVTQIFGDSLSAVSCADSIVAESGVPTEFTPEALEQAKTVGAEQLTERDMASRLDLRGEPIFTIDGAGTKDIDDAVSIRKTETGWEVGVHIADVSHYVRPGSALDQDAYARTTSIYYADRVIPMLPKELSNGICSLNPNEDRLAFSALLQLDPDGKMQSYSFRKTVIRSVMQGVYEEINQILDDTASPEIREKYALLQTQIHQLAELAALLTKNRFSRGGFDLESSEARIVMGEDGRVRDVVRRERGQAERIIEELMLTANEAAASFGTQAQVPFLFRVHERPAQEKIELLRELASLLGLEAGIPQEGLPHSAVTRLLSQVKDTPASRIVNNQVLRTMAKAKYSERNVGHYGLALDLYTHFTSPIRRYPDLLAHRMMSQLLSGTPKEKMMRRYESFLPAAANATSQGELRAMTIERDCDACYKAEYMRAHLGEQFSGVISAVVPHGVYVELPNGVEGLIRMESLPHGEYMYDGSIQMTERLTGTKYRVGEPLEIMVAAADIASGRVDFVPAGEAENATGPKAVRKREPAQKPRPAGKQSTGRRQPSGKKQEPVKKQESGKKQGPVKKQESGKKQESAKKQPSARKRRPARKKTSAETQEAAKKK